MPPEAAAAPLPAAPSQAAAPGSAHHDAYAAIDGLFNQPGDDAPEPQKETPDETPAPDKTGDQKPVPEKKDQRQDDKAKTDLKEQQTQKPEKAATLREAKDRAETENKTLKARVAELEKKIATPEDHPEKKKWDEERETLTKSRAQLEEELKYANYEHTTEYKTEYEEPFVNAYATGRQKAAVMKVKLADKVDANGQTVDGGTRNVTGEDFDKFMQIGDDIQAEEYAKDVFGNGANIMIRQRERIQELNQKRFNAVEKYRKEGMKREKDKAEREEGEAKEYKGLFEAEVKTAQESDGLKHWFTVDEGDDVGKDLLQKGKDMTDLAFGDTSALTKQQRARLYAAVKNRAIAARILDHKLAKATAERDELKKKLAEYEDSEPNLDGKGGKKKEGGEKAPTGYSAFDSAVDNMASRR